VGAADRVRFVNFQGSDCDGRGIAVEPIAFGDFLLLEEVSFFNRTPEIGALVGRSLDRAFALRWLDVRGGNLSWTARELDVPIQTLHQWSRGTRMAWCICRSTQQPLKNLRVFRGRSLPVWHLGEPIPIDLSRLTGKEHEQLLRLLARARTDLPDGSG
jgi:hypothetical protein